MKIKNFFLLALLMISINAFSQKLVKTYWDWSKTKLQAEYYTDKYGTKNGSFKGYSEFGGLLMQGTFKDGLPIGKWIEKYENGKLHYIKHYNVPGYTNLNIKEGSVISYYEDGKTLKYEKNFKDGELDGLIKEYDEYGNLINEGKYVNGIFERTGETKRIYDEEKEKENQLKSEEYKKIIIEADKASLEKNYIKALELYGSAYVKFKNEKYPKEKASEIFDTYKASENFINKYIKSQKDSLELDRDYFASKIALKTKKHELGWVTTIDENGVLRRLDSGNTGTVSEFKLDKPWENFNLEFAKSCFKKNEGIYRPVQIIITEQFIRYKFLLNEEENNLRKSLYNLYIDGNYNPIYTYDKSTFLKNISKVKMNYSLAKSLIELESKKAQIKTIHDQNKKRTLFSKSEILYNDFNLSLQNNTELSNLANNINELNILLDKIITLYSQDTKELEKQLKNSDTVESIKSIILGK